MATPVDFPEQNGVLGKPASMRDDECLPLPVYRDGQQCISCWRLTDQELALVNDTGCVFVGVLSGDTQPPIWVKGAAPEAVHSVEALEARQRQRITGLGQVLGLAEADLPQFTEAVYQAVQTLKS